MVTLQIRNVSLRHDLKAYPFPPPVTFVQQPVILTSDWFVDLPKYGVLRFDYVSTSRPDHHQTPLPERRFQVQVLPDSVSRGLLFACILLCVM